MKDEIRITVIATGFDSRPAAKSWLHEEISRSTFTDGGLDVSAFLRKKGE